MMTAYPSTNLLWVVAQPATASFNATPVGKEQQTMIYAQMVLTGATSPVGTLTLQASADGAYAAANWATVSANGTAQTIAVSANGVFSFNTPYLSARAFRVIWTFTSGTAGTWNFMYNIN